MLVSEIYNSTFSTIDENSTIAEAMKIILDQDYNSLLVINGNNRLTGVLSLQDIAGAIVPQEMRDNTNLAHALYKKDFFQEQCDELRNKKVMEIMRTDFITVTKQTSVLEIAADFLHNDLYIVPVLENKQLIGIVTRSEIKHAIATGLGIS